MATFNLKLDSAIQETGTTLDEVATLCNLSRGAVSKAINGFTAKPHPRTIAKLCAGLNRTPEELGFAGVEVAK